MKNHSFKKFISAIMPQKFLWRLNLKSLKNWDGNKFYISTKRCIKYKEDIKKISKVEQFNDISSTYKMFNILHYEIYDIKFLLFLVYFKKYIAKRFIICLRNANRRFKIIFKIFRWIEIKNYMKLKRICICKQAIA